MIAFSAKLLFLSTTIRLVTQLPLRPCFRKWRDGADERVICVQFLFASPGGAYFADRFFSEVLNMLTRKPQMRTTLLLTLAECAQSLRPRLQGKLIEAAAAQVHNNIGNMQNISIGSSATGMTLSYEFILCVATWVTAWKRVQKCIGTDCVGGIVPCVYRIITLPAQVHTGPSFNGR